MLTRSRALKASTLVVAVLGTAALAAQADAPTAAGPAVGAEAPAGLPIGAPGDWPEWRGPMRDGRSPETDLPERWSTDGDNLAWRVPYGGRSTPVIVGDRLYLQNISGYPDLTQERILCLDVNSGDVVWERKFSVYLSDVPAHRAAWASPAVDPETGNVYLFTVGGQVLALASDGELVWTRSLPEEFGVITTHGGRTVSPVVDEDRVLVSEINAGWGDIAATSNRYFAFDKRTGETIWVSTPQEWHYDTNYATPIVAEIDGVRQYLVGGTDGSFHALEARTGRPLWRWHVSKRAINNSALVDGATVYASHSEENLGTSVMGMVAAIDGRARGDVDESAVRWSTLGHLGGFPSPVMDDERIYQMDNTGVLAAFDRESGDLLWRHTLGTIQKGSPVLADGKLYIGTENGRFYILRPGAEGVEVLDEEWLGSQAEPEAIIAAPAVSNGRVYVTSMSATYAIGPETIRGPAGGEAPSPTAADPGGAGADDPAPGEPVSVLVVPFEVRLAPGEPFAFRAEVYDANGQRLPDRDVAWSVDGVGGEVGPDGRYTAPAEGAGAATVTATVGSLTGVGRVRVIPPLPWSIDFSDHEGEAAPSHWINATGPGRFVVREVDGARALFRERNDTIARRVRAYLGEPDWSDYTIEADVRVAEQRRQMGDVGVIAQRYVLVLFGTNQRVELQPWQAADFMTVQEDFAWEPDQWYRIKLRVENRDDGMTLAQGKVWPADQPEPDEWLVEKQDAIGHREGSPALFSDAGSDMAFNNIKVYRNDDAPQKSSH